MTVEKLILFLSVFPEDAEVVLVDDEVGLDYTPESIRLRRDGKVEIV